ncbi:thioesterase family protein [Microbulbifer bruguierae]|uniref:Thioesterase family protein n=1 Tax=Microbulbifer bruguierae TaxID=3029061 RepID=A0ABY8NFV0_9GAMM|nr:thioesterase family protein [Microbulbifer bruguierae]WGL17244.1 thioesterase family protein [Microbulbifer bruguierae]
MTEPSYSEFRQMIEGTFESVPFVREVGLQLHQVDFEKQTLSAIFARKPQLIGNHYHNILHGGVIATALDQVGGFTAMVAAYQRMGGAMDWEEKIQRLMRLGTVDMRVDYLKPGRGEHFLCSGSILRVGNKLVVTRMELHNDTEELIATGTATFLY